MPPDSSASSASRGTHSPPDSPRRGSITSASNRLIVDARALLHTRARRDRREFLAEGPRLIGDALQEGVHPLRLFVAPDLLDRSENGRRLLEQAAALPTVEVNAAVLRTLSDTETPQGAVAIFPMPDPPTDLVEGELPLVLDGLQDPGNLGTILRSAVGAGVTRTVLLRGGADPYAPKVVRSAAGALLDLRIARNDERLLVRLLESRRLWVAEAGDGQPYHRADWCRPAALAIGSEAHGVSDELRQRAAGRVAVPLSGGLDSLNAGVAASIILFEAARQRAASPQPDTMRPRRRE